MNKNLIIGILALLVVIGGFLYFTRGSESTFGGTTNLDTLALGDGLKVGSSGTTMAEIITGTASLIASNYTSLAASTTLTFDIAVTGVSTGDIVFAQFATSTGVGAGWLITQASASTTAGFITLGVVNNTGVAATIPASIASTTKYLVIDN